MPDPQKIREYSLFSVLKASVRIKTGGKWRMPGLKTDCRVSASELSGGSRDLSVKCSGTVSGVSRNCAT